MKRKKNYRQFRSKSSARNRLNEIKSRSVVPDTRHSDATAQAVNNDLLGEYADNPAYGELPEDRFDNAPPPDFQFDWDEEFFGTASPGSSGLTEAIPFGFESVEEEPAATENTEVKLETGAGFQEELTADIIPETDESSAEELPENQPEQERQTVISAAPARFVSVKRRMAAEKREAEKMKKPQATKQAVINNAVAKKADSPEGKKVGSMTFGLPPKFGQSTAINKVERTVTAIQKPPTSNSGVKRKSEVPSLNVRHAPSFRSFVISTIQKLIEQKRIPAWEQELLSSEPETGIRHEPADNETGRGGITRWNNPLLTGGSAGLGHTAGKKGSKNSNSLPEEKQPATRSSLARGKSKPAPESYQLNAARFTLMEAMLNAKAFSGNMRMKR